jgi:hypothetical protein
MANITINSTPTRVQYTAAAAQSVYSYTFPIKADSDLKVYSRAAAAAAVDATDILVLGAGNDYTVTGANTAGGGTVLLNVASTAGDIVTIVGDKPVDRTAIYDQSVTLSKADLNNDFNDNVMYDKQIETIQDQLMPKYPRSELIGPSSRQDNLILPILNDGYIWVGVGNQGDATDNIGTLLPASLVNLDATFILQVADGAMQNAQALGDLGTGILYNTTATGVLSIVNIGAGLNLDTGTQTLTATGIGTVNTVATGGTGVSSLTTYALLAGGTTTTGAIQQVTPIGTSGESLVSAGAGALPAWGVAAVLGGGTGVASHTAYAVLCGGTTGTGAVQSIASVGTANQVLTSNGAGALPTFQNSAAGGIWTQVAKVTVAASPTTVDFDGVFDGTYDTYRIEFRDLDCTSNSQGRWRVGTGAGPTYATTLYRWAFMTTGGITQGSQSDTAMTFFQFYNGRSETGAGSLMISTPNDATNNVNINARCAGMVPNTNSMGVWTSCGTWFTATALTSIQFITNAGTINTGEFVIYGMTVA